MTENDAKTKWCPMARSLVTANDMPICSANIGQNNARLLCVGSDCMMWREQTAFVEKKREAIGEKPSGVFQKTGHGYCGLAGKP